MDRLTGMWKRFRFARKAAEAAPSAALLHSRRKMENEKSARHLGYTLAATALSAKLAKADGGIHKAEVESFHRFMPHLAPESREMLFNEAALDSAGFEHYARRMKAYFKEDAAFLKKTLSALVEFAAADGPINGEEIVFLKKVNHIFGFSDEHFYAELKEHILPKTKEPCAVLGVEKGASAATIKKAYYKAAASYHPDKLASVGSKELLVIANQRMTLIHHAYESLSKRARMH